MQNSANKSSYLKQAGILAAAGIICRIIGILYRSPLTSIIGDEGNGYYSSAYNIYTIILLLSSYSIPSAVSKIIAAKLALKEYRNAHRIFRCALIYVSIVGGLASLFTFFGAGLLVEKDARIVLQVFAPTIFISGFVGVLRGYFQAHGSMVQTSLSQIVEQILNAVISVVAAYALISIVKSQTETTKAVYGAAGSALGTGSGVVIALLFMILMYLLNRKVFLKRRKKDQHKYVESYRDIMRGMMSTVTPIILSTFIYNFSTSLNQTVYLKTMIYLKGFTAVEASTAYGILAGKSMVILNIPIAIAAALSSTMIPTISASCAIGNKADTNRKIEHAMWFTMLIAIPSAVGMGVLSKPIMQLLFPQKESLEMAARLLMLISAAVVFYSLSTLSNGILQGIGKVNLPVRNAAIALSVQTVLLIALLAFTDLNIYALVICLLVYSGLMCVLNSLSVRRHMGFREDFKKILFLPLLCAIVMGAAAGGVYWLIDHFTGRSLIALLPALMTGVAVYAVMVIKTGAITRNQILSLPKGRLILKIVVKLHLMNGKQRGM